MRSRQTREIMETNMKQNTKFWIAAGLAAVVAPAALMAPSFASDHADTPNIVANPGTDLTDVFLFPSPSNPDKVVLAMNVNPLIAAGQGGAARFDPNVLYQFKIDNNGDAVEDLVIQAKFFNFGSRQGVAISSPTEPVITGTNSRRVFGQISTGEINTTFNARGGMKVFVGAREDPFFFDLERFFAILPDRATPLTGIPIANPNAPQLTSWRAPGEAVDFLSNGGFNVLSIIVELPKSKLRANGQNSSSVIGVWTTTSTPSGNVFVQQDRLARPVINEVFATVANNRHEVNNMIAPTGDAAELRNDIESFLTFPANRSTAIKEVIKAVLIPDVLKADLNGTGAAYLGFETGGATGGTFGGRKLTDDVVDISLGIVFGTTISDLGLAPADGNQIPTLTSDNVGAEGKQFTSTFPYMGAPR